MPRCKVTHRFDQVFDEETEQAQLYASVGPQIVQTVPIATFDAEPHSPCVQDAARLVE